MSVDSAPVLLQSQMLSVPLVGVYPIPLADANSLLVAWGHKMGPLNRPFRTECWSLLLDGNPVALATSSSIVNGPVGGYSVQQVVELSRLCAAPGNRWANRVMLRLWREVCAPRWACWPVLAAVSYSANTIHTGDIYRTDGWTKIRSDAGGYKGNTWGAKRAPGDVLYGSKTLWLWKYEDPPPSAAT